MVDKIFYIKGDKIFDVGLRFSLVGLGGEYNIKVQAVNERSDDRVRVVTSGNVQSISKFYNYVQNNDVRYYKDENTQYNVTELEGYSGPKIDYSYYQNSFNTEQLGKILYTAGNQLPKTEHKIDSIDDNVRQVKESLKSIDSKFPWHEKAE